MSKIRNLSPTIKVLAVPSLVIVGSAILAIVIIKSGIPSVMTRMREAQESKVMTNSLEDRLSVLQELNKSYLDNQSDRIYTVLPDKNFGAATVSHVRSLALSEGVVLEQISSGSPGVLQADIQKTDINYELSSSDMNQALRLLARIRKIAPLTSVEEADIVRVEGKFTSKLRLAIYWSSLPSKLPSLSEPITQLSAKELQTLSSIQEFQLPAFVDIPAQGQNASRENPFN